MPPSAYPPKATVPRSFEHEEPSEYPVTVSPKFADGSMDFNLDADVKIRQWVVSHDVITEAEAASLDSHVESARYNPSTGSAYAFDFVDRAGATHTNVRYAPGGYERPPHTKKIVQYRRVRLVKYP